MLVMQRAELEHLDHLVVEAEAALAQEDRAGAVGFMAAAVSVMTGKVSSRLSEPAMRSNADNTMFQSAIGLSKMSRTGTLLM